MKKNKIIITILFIIHCSLLTTSAQSWQELMDSTNVYMEKQDYKTALQWAEKAEALAKNELGDSDTNYIASLTRVYLCNYYLAKYEKAIELCESAISLIKEIKGDESPEFAEGINNLGNFYHASGKSDTAESFIENALKIRRKIFKADHHDLATSINNLAEFYNDIGIFDKAEPLYKEALEMNRRLYKDDNSDLALSINNLALFYQQRGRISESESLLIEALLMYRRIYKNDNMELATIINNVALFNYNKGDFLQAEQMFKEALEMRRRIFKEDHPDLAGSINNLADFCKVRGRNIEAEQLFLEAIAMYRRLYKNDHQSLSNIINNYGSFLQGQGRYSEAEPLLVEALEINKRIFNKDNMQLAISLNNLGSFYKTIGQYGKAEPLYIEALEMIKRLFNNDNPNTAALINNLAAFYHSVGRYNEAESLYVEALSMYRRLFKTEHPALANIINNIAMYYNVIGNYSKAQILLEEALEMYRKIFKSDHSSLAMAISNLGYFYYERGLYEKSEQLFIESLEMRRRLFKTNHPDLAGSLNNLATLYFSLNRYSEAESLYLESIKIYRNIYNENHPDLALSIHSLAFILENQFRYSEAKIYYLELLKICQNLINNYFPSLSEIEKEQYYKTFSKYHKYFNNFILKCYRKETELIGDLYNKTILTKGILLNSTKKVKDRIYNSNDTTIIKLFKQWSDIREKLSKLFKMTNQQLSKKGIDMDSVNKEANDIEKVLSKRSENFKKEFDNEILQWQDIKKFISNNDAIIEIIRLNLYDREWTDTIYYIALIIKKNLKNPEMVLIKNGNDLDDKYLSNYYSSIIHQLDDKDSYNQYWKPIADKLKGIKKVYLSVDGVYNQINLNTLKNPKTGEYLLAEKEIVLLTSTRDLLERNNSNSLSQNTAELFGDPKYNLDSTKHIELAMTYKNTDKPYIERGIVDSLMTRGSFAPLPGTRKEIENIYKILKTKEWGVNLHLGEGAIEEAVKSVNSPRILHIATHGMFLKDIDKSKEDDRMFGMETKRFVENPLLRSMLLFAGADNTISKKGESTVDTKTDDGLLTAYEAMNLNLDNTELVVLSACETGLGDIKNGEGVYGLQRSFVQAGAKSIIMSLWKVSDEASQELMTAFYTKWLSGKPKRQAFRDAQIEMMKQHPEPFYWGAFVMVGE